MFSEKEFELEPACGVYLSELSPGDALDIETENRAYHLIYSGHGRGFLSGHPIYCPQGLLVTICGSGLGDKLLCGDYLGEGLHMEFRHPGNFVVTTSRILAVRRAAKSLATATGRDGAGPPRADEPTIHKERNHVQ